MYKALIQFRDLDGQIYDKGADYPRGDVSDERIQQLLTANNRTGKPVIMADPPQAVSLEEMSVPLLREYARENDIDLTGARGRTEILEIIQAGAD